MINQVLQCCIKMSTQRKLNDEDYKLYTEFEQECRSIHLKLSDISDEYANTKIY